MDLLFTSISKLLKFESKEVKYAIFQNVRNSKTELDILYKFIYEFVYSYYMLCKFLQYLKKN